jgi:hypothetical protein
LLHSCSILVASCSARRASAKTRTARRGVIHARAQEPRTAWRGRRPFSRLRTSDNTATGGGHARAQDLRSTARAASMLALKNPSCPRPPCRRRLGSASPLPGQSRWPVGCSFPIKYTPCRHRPGSAPVELTRRPPRARVPPDRRPPADEDCRLHRDLVALHNRRCCGLV